MLEDPNRIEEKNSDSHFMVLINDRSNIYNDSYLNIIRVSLGIEIRWKLIWTRGIREGN